MVLSNLIPNISDNILNIIMLIRIHREPLVILINLNDGSRAANPVFVRKPLKITKEEFNLISGGCPDRYKPVKGIIINELYYSNKSLHQVKP